MNYLSLNLKRLLYFIDKEGNNQVEKLLFNQERPDLLLNPFLEFLMKKQPWNALQIEKANLMSAYYLNLNNPIDLDVKIIFYISELLTLQKY